MSLPFCSVNVVYSYAMNPNTASIVNGTSRIEERLHSAEYNLAGWIFDDYLCCVAYLPVVSYESFEMYLFVVFFWCWQLIYTHEWTIISFTAGIAENKSQSVLFYFKFYQVSLVRSME